jgi:hypothetical protein
MGLFPRICLIARNLLFGMKTCSDVFQYMNYIKTATHVKLLAVLILLLKKTSKVAHATHEPRSIV